MSSKDPKTYMIGDELVWLKDSIELIPCTMSALNMPDRITIEVNEGLGVPMYYSVLLESVAHPNSSKHIDLLAESMGIEHDGRTYRCNRDESSLKYYREELLTRMWQIARWREECGTDED